MKSFNALPPLVYACVRWIAGGCVIDLFVQELGYPSSSLSSAMVTGNSANTDNSPVPHQSLLYTPVSGLEGCLIHS